MSYLQEKNKLSVKITKVKSIIITIAIFLAVEKICAQNPLHSYANNRNTWMMYFGDHKVSNKWGIHLKAQWRRNDFLEKPQQLLLRTGVNYHLNNNTFITAGYCYVQTNPYGGFPVKASFPENRFWEQIQTKTQSGIFEWVSRIRLEQRLSNLPILVGTQYEPGDAVYTNRLRLLNRISIPLKGKSIKDKTVYLSAYDELFINFGKNIASNIFDQNRAYIALGYKIPKMGKLEIGYMRQNIQKADGVKIERNSNLQMGLTSNIDFYFKRKAPIHAHHKDIPQGPKCP